MIAGELENHIAVNAMTVCRVDLALLRRDIEKLPSGPRKKELRAQARSLENGVRDTAMTLIRRARQPL